jgi:hypothetical protein
MPRPGSFVREQGRESGGNFSSTQGVLFAAGRLPRHEGFDRKGESLSEEETRARDNMKRERNQRRSKNWSGVDEVAVEDDEGFIQEHWSCRRSDAGSERHGHENPHSTTLT